MQPSHFLAAMFLLAPAAAQQTRLNGPLARPLGGDIFEHALSPDGTRVVYRADQLSDGTIELFSAKSTGGGSPLRLAGAAFPGGDVAWFEIGPAGRRVVLAGSLEASGVSELFSVPIDGGPVVKLSGALPEGGDVLLTAGSIQIDRAESRVVYLADQEQNDVVELFSVSIAGGAAVKLNAPLVAGGDVLDFQLAPDGTSVVYRADQDTDGVPGLYAVSILGGPAVELGPAGLSVRGEYRIDALSTRVAFAAGTSPTSRVQLYSSHLGGLGAALPLLPALVDSARQPLPVRDGARIVWVLGESSPQRTRLASVALDGSGVLDLHVLQGTRFFGQALAFTRDGQALVYTTLDPGVTRELYRTALDGTSPPTAIAEIVSDSFELSPDGTRVVYATLLQPTEVGVFSALLDLSAPPTLLATGIVGRFALAPDGKRVVFGGQTAPSPTLGNELFSVPITGGQAPTKLTPPLPFGGSVDLGTRAFQVSALGRAVYVADQVVDEVLELFSVPIEGGTAVRVSGDMPTGPVEGDVLAHAITPDGKHAVYLADELENDRPELFSVRTGGGQAPTRLHGPLADGERIDRFTLSPDGATVAYWLVKPSSERELRAVPTIGGASTLLASGLVNVSAFAIEPTGARVLYGSGASGAHALRSVALDGSSAPVLLDSGFAGSVQELVFAPASGRVLYRATDTGTVTSLRSVPADGSSAALVLQGGGRVLAQTLAADGARVVFVADALVPGRFEAFVAPVDGSAAPLRLNPDLAATGGVQTLRTAGDFAFYTAEQDSPGVRELYRVPLDGSATAVKLNGALVGGGDVLGFEPTADGARVVYHADQEVDQRWELYSAPGDGSAAAVKLNGPLGAGYVGGDVFFDDVFRGVYRLSPDGQRVAFRADPGPDGSQELFVAPIDGSAAAVRVSRPTSSGDTVLSDFQFTPDGATLVFGAALGWRQTNQIRMGVLHAPADGSRPARLLSTLGGFAQPVLSILPGGGRVVYRFDGETPNVIELFASSLERPHARQDTPQRLVTRTR